MTYACPALEFMADTYLKKLQNKVLYTTGNFPRCILTCEFYVVFNIPHIYDYHVIQTAPVFLSERMLHDN
jgi:hypothetical protein